MTRRTITLLMAALICCAASPAFCGDREVRPVTLNLAALEHARELIKQGHAIADGKGLWSEHQLSAEEENEFIRLHGFAEYEKWHLGIDDRYAENTKRRYKFPYGDFKNVHRCGLLAVKARARQYKYPDIEDAAARLIEIIRQRK